MPIPMLSPSRCVLLIGDEGLSVFSVTARVAKHIDSVPWQTDGFETIVASLIRNDCGGKPVLILNDMTDQHFKGGQRLPAVGVMDRASVLQRRLQVAFPNYPIRGALAIKPGKESSRNPQEIKEMRGLYLFAAVPISDAINKTLEAVKQSYAIISGFCLLPIESSDMVSALAKKLTEKTQAPAKWSIFIGQHLGNSLRQVIVRDGQLAMTRMTPMVDPDVDPGVWAQEVSKEFSATISYLSRFGYTPQDTADVIVICKPDAGREFESFIDIPCRYSAITAPEAARELGITIGIQDKPYLADALHVAWIGRKTTFVLPMKMDGLGQINKIRQGAAAAMGLLLLSAVYFSWTLIGQMGIISEKSGKLDEQKGMVAQAEQEYNDSLAQLERLGFDVKLVQGSIDTFREMQLQNVHTLSFVNAIDKALGDDLRINALSLAYTPKDIAEGVDPNAPDTVKGTVNAVIKLSFPTTIDPEEGVRQVNDLKQRLSTFLPNYTVNVDKNVAGLEYSDSFSGSAGRTAEEIVAESKQDFIAEISLRRDVTNAPPVTPATEAAPAADGSAPVDPANPDAAAPVAEPGDILAPEAVPAETPDPAATAIPDSTQGGQPPAAQ